VRLLATSGQPRLLFAGSKPAHRQFWWPSDLARARGRPRCRRPWGGDCSRTHSLGLDARSEGTSPPPELLDWVCDA